VLALPTVALGTFLLAGCGTANEEDFIKSSERGQRKEGTPDFKSYGEAQQYQAQQAAKERPAGKGKPILKNPPKSP